jgi:hypothetical protein
MNAFLEFLIALLMIFLLKATNITSGDKEISPLGRDMLHIAKLTKLARFIFSY